MSPWICRAIWSAAVLCVAWPVNAGQFAVERTDDGVTVRLDGQLVTKYLVRSGAKPILYPVIGPTGRPMTRAYPMEAIDGERKDHVHHRSLWFTHGDVNGVDFWGEAAKVQGTIVHREFLRADGGERAVISTANDWLDPDGQIVCRDVRTITIGAGMRTRTIDFDITVTAGAKQVTFGDTKEGMFGVRVPTSMDVDSKLGGQIVNSEGQTDRAAWGQPAAWVDYHGPVDGETLGVAILNHPSSFRFPTHWHVRTYGLFAANPFGLSDFQGSEDVNGAHTLAPGESFTFRYRVILHEGDETSAKIGEAFSAYAAEPKP